MYFPPHALTPLPQVPVTQRTLTLGAPMIPSFADSPALMDYVADVAVTVATAETNYNCEIGPQVTNARWENSPATKKSGIKRYPRVRNHPSSWHYMKQLQPKTCLRK